MAAGDESRFREKKINLAALRKLDPYAGSILDTASSVAHYKFDPATEKWEKTEFEGSLFVYNRNESKTEVAFLIMNRLRKENFHITVKSGMEFKPQDPFLLCRTPTEIIGIWFYNPSECARISALLSRIAELADDELQLKKEIDEALDEIYKIEAPKVDVLKMFAKAKEEYDKNQSHKDHINKSASMPKFVQSEQKRPIILKRTNSVPDGIHEAEEPEEEQGISMHASKGSNTLLKLLQQSKTQGRKSRARTLSYGESKIVDSNRDLKDSIKRLNETMAGDLAFVDVPKRGARSTVDGSKPQMIDVAKLEASVLLSQDVTDSKGDKGQEQNTEQAGDTMEVTSVPKEIARIAVTSATLLSPANITPTKPTITKSGIGGKGRGKGLAAVMNLSETKAGDKSSMPPGSIMSLGALLKTASESQKSTRREIAFSMKFPEPPQVGTATSLMSPMQFTASTKTTLSQDTNTPSELSQLNKQQFKDAFINLLQTDDGFLEKLHHSYLSLKSRK